MCFFNKVKDLFYNKDVALVGNASFLLEKDYGYLIDKHQVVCRINQGITLLGDKCYGSKLDILFVSDFKKMYDDIDCIKIKTNRLNTDYELNYPLDSIMYLKDKIGITEKKIHPTTGISAFDIIETSNPLYFTLYGFDWKLTPTFYDTNREEDPHDYIREKKYIISVIKNNRNFFYIG